MKIGDTVIYQVNPKVQRPAKILQENADKTCDLSVYLHPDDYPEFSKEQCATGTGVVRNIKEGLNPGEYFYKPAATAATAETATA